MLPFMVGVTRYGAIHEFEKYQNSSDLSLGNIMGFGIKYFVSIPILLNLSLSVNVNFSTP